MTTERPDPADSGAEAETTEPPIDSGDEPGYGTYNAVDADGNTTGGTMSYDHVQDVRRRLRAAPATIYASRASAASVEEWLDRNGREGKTVIWTD